MGSTKWNDISIIIDHTERYPVPSNAILARPLYFTDTPPGNIVPLCMVTGGGKFLGSTDTGSGG
jgi:hypothetical protein